MNKLKYILSALLILCATINLWGDDTKKVKITISAQNYGSHKMVIAFDTDEYIRKELDVKDGKYEIEYEISAPVRAILVNKDPSLNINIPGGYIPSGTFEFFIQPGETVELSFKNEEWPVVSVAGGVLNQESKAFREKYYASKLKEWKLMKEYYSIPSVDTAKIASLKKLRQKESEDQLAFMYNFILENPVSYVALFYLHHNMSKISKEQLIDAYDNLRQYWSGHKLANEIALKIEASERITEGAMAPDFLKKDKDGKEIKLSDYKGRYLLIDFWGTWCAPCRASHPHLLSLYNEYSKKGVDFINIASEGSASERVVAKWLNAITVDNLIWTQILNDVGIESCDLVKLFNIAAFPTKILIGKDGKILVIEVGDSVRIEDELKKLLN